mmetsp:Transcript_17310/g.34719  ORF Transcript_17310/g.34719 Transcript_17310/m.34719 type:complete len:85 (-) Transcript_17310:299-553(-)
MLVREYDDPYQNASCHGVRDANEIQPVLVRIDISIEKPVDVQNRENCHHVRGEHYASETDLVAQPERYAVRYAQNNSYPEYGIG